MSSIVDKHLHYTSGSGSAECKGVHISIKLSVGLNWGSCFVYQGCTLKSSSVANVVNVLGF